MTVSVQAPFVTRVYSGPGDYDFDFLLYDDAHLQVSLVATGEEEAQVLTVAYYSVVSLQPDNGGTVTIVDPDEELPASGTLYIRRILPYQQPIDWINNERFNMELLERSQDQLVMMIQQIAQSALDLSVIVSWPEGVPDLYAMVSSIQETASGAEALAVLNASILANQKTFDSITDLRAATGISDGAVCILKGYYASGDGGGGLFVYMAGNHAAKVLADPTYGIYVPLNSNPSGSAGVLKRICGNEWSVLWFGADNTAALDSAPALRGLCTLAEYVGGATANFPSGKYRLASMDLTHEDMKDERNACNLGSHTHFTGLGECEIWLDGATLDPIAESGYRFNFFGTKRGAVQNNIKGFKFTTNGWVLVTNFESCRGVNVSGDYTTIEDCWFYNLPGRNHLLVGSNNSSWPAYVHYPRFTVVRNCVFQNGSDVVPGNTVAIDCGFYYTNGYDGLFENNVLINDSLPTINCSGVENHNGRNVYRNNYFKNMWPAVYIGVEGGITDGLVFEGNFIETCYGGIQTIQSTHGCKVIDNYFLNNHTTADAPGAVDHQGGKNLFSTLAGATGIADGTLDSMIVKGNTFKEDAYVGSSCIHLGALQNAIISENTFYGFSDCIVVALASNRPTKGVMIHDNVASFIPTTDYPYVHGIITFLGGDTWAATADHIHCWDNTAITDVLCPKVTEYVVVGLLATYTNCAGDVMRSKNISVGVTGTEYDQLQYPNPNEAPVGYTPFWTQSADPQPSLGNGTLQGYYKVVGNICTVTFEFVAGSTTTFGNSASGWYFGLPKYSVYGFNQRLVIYFETNNVSYPAQGTIGAHEIGMSIGLNNQGVRLDFPTTHGAGTKIRATFSYFIDVA